MIKKSSSFPLLLLGLSLFIISACSGGHSPITDSWIFSQDINVAERAPETLSSGGALPTPYESGQKAAVERETLNAPQDQSHTNQQITAQYQQRNNEPVKVAILLPLSGEHAALGQAMLNAAQLALFDLEQSGFELLPRDTKGTPQGAKDAARAALNDDSKLILGPLFASSVREVRSIADRHDVNVIAFSTDWSLAGDNTFLMGFLPFDQIERLAHYVSYREYESVGVLAPDTDYGRVVTSAYERVSPYFNIMPAKATFFEAGTNNLTPTIRTFSEYDERVAQAEMEAAERFNGIGDPEVVSALKRVSEPLDVPLPYDAVLLPMGGEVARNTANLLSHFDMPPSKVQRLGTGLMDDLGLASEQSLDRTIFAAPSPRLRAPFEARYQDLYGATPPRLSTLAYDATALAVILARNSMAQNGYARFSKADIMNRNGFSGIDGIFRFRGNGTVERGLALLQFRNGKVKVLDEAPRTFQNIVQ